MGLLAFLFTVLGLWMGRKLTRKETITVEKVVYAGVPFRKNEQALSELGLSRRECEVLELMAEGLSNQEIADRLFVSLHTIKTHSSNLFLKLQVSRRTQAVSRAKELHLIP
jgi:NarL family two-component system response regulator LiaR